MVGDALAVQLIGRKIEFMASQRLFGRWLTTCASAASDHFNACTTFAPQRSSGALC
jgi:hypothetical protein